MCVSSVYMCVCTYVHVRLCIRVYMCVRMCVSVYQRPLWCLAFLRVSIRACVYVCAPAALVVLGVRVYVCIRACVYTCVPAALVVLGGGGLGDVDGLL